VTKNQRIRAVLDTNLFISGLFASTGTIATLQQLWISGAFELAVSEEILLKIKRTLQKPYLQKELSLRPQEIDEVLGMIREKLLW
jgi:putative PIN family toxin of toxin-antitoxin system